MTIDILCKVVDNFGDIGVVYRLAKALTELDSGLELRLLVDDLSAFHALCPSVEVGRTVQTVNGWTVACWGAPEPDPNDADALELFRSKRPRTVIECFACGRPDWYEDILFDETDEEKRLIVDLEYLTAESWAIDFHRLPSLTRSAKVRKAMFMPGFVAGTGGLIRDTRFSSLHDAYLDEGLRPALRRALLETIAAASGRVIPETTLGAEAEAFWVTVFSYEKDYGSIVGDLKTAAAHRPLMALSAAGRSAAPFREAWEDAGQPFPLIELPFLSQETWDEVILASDFAIVRGEDSLSRAALSGRPFLWHAYPVNDGNQRKKVRALLDLQRPFFIPADFSRLEALWMAFNEEEGHSLSRTEGLADLLGLCGGGRLDLAFRDWSESVMKIGNLAEALLTFIRDFG